MMGLFLLVFFATLPCGGLAAILPLTYQSSGLTFNNWVLVFTLCFAPLIAHVLAGVPNIVYLSQDRPSWCQKLSLYNPTTILWRYFAIADRRLRAKRWNAADMSSSNVYFWTRGGWDGSEVMMGKSRAYCVSLPQSKHLTLVSGSMLKTVIVTLQGADSLYFLVWSNFETTNGTNFATTASVASLFSPLAILGLMRLVACFWLTEDFAYISCEEVQTTLKRLKAETEQLVPVQTRGSRTLRTTSESWDLSGTWTGGEYRSHTSWQSWLFRTMYLLPLLGLLVLCTANLIRIFSPYAGYPTTHASILLFYNIILVVTVIVLGYNFTRSRNTTTVLPCISSSWYQVYTCMLFVSMLVLIIIASLETFKSPCGFYTTFPSYWSVCGATIPSTKTTIDGVFGLGVIGNMTTSWGFNFTHPQGEMSLLYFYGSCQGYFDGNSSGTVEGFRFSNTTIRNSSLPLGG